MIKSDESPPPNPPTIPPSAPPPPVNPTTPKINILIAINILFFILVIALVAYFLGTRTGQTKKEIPPVEKPTVTTTPKEISASPTAEPTVSSPSPTKRASKANANLFTSETLGISFYTAKVASGGVPGSTVHTLETSNKVYVYLGNSKPESGQYVEVFEKSPSDTLPAAIKKRFLAGIAETDCFVKIEEDKTLPSNFVKATIAYPVPDNADQPAFTYGQMCPESYKRSNGISYFLYDKGHPNRFLFLSIGQYVIGAENGKDTPSWQDTIEIF